MLAHGLAVEVEFGGYRRHTPPVLLQVAYVHKILQVEHWAPWSAQRFHTWGFFDRRYWGIFNWGLLPGAPALIRPCRCTWFRGCQRNDRSTFAQDLLDKRR